MTDEAEDAVAAAATALYAASPAEFVATRKALAATARSAAGPAAAKAVLALRKPTLTAWAMNLTSRDGAGVVADLVGLGARMRAAQARLDAEVLTSVRGERDARVAAYVDRVAEVASAAGVTISDSGRDEVRASAVAALADESASQALASGQLTRALSYSGFGEVDLSGAVGVTSSGSIVSVLPGGAQGTAPPERDRGSGSEAEDEDEDELTDEELAQAVADAKAAKAAAKERRRAEAELAAVEAEMTQAQAELDAAESAARVARRTVVQVQSRLDAARAAVAALDG